MGGDASHHTDFEPTAEDREMAEKLSELGDLFADVFADVPRDGDVSTVTSLLKDRAYLFFYGSLTTMELWTRVARAFRIAGFKIDFGAGRRNPHEPYEFRAQYMCEPQRPVPGTYCRRCGHSDPMYMDRMAAKVRRDGDGRTELPCCGNKHCLCTSHMVETYTVDTTSPWPSLR